MACRAAHLAPNLMVSLPCLLHVLVRARCSLQHISQAAVRTQRSLCGRVPTPSPTVRNPLHLRPSSLVDCTTCTARDTLVLCPQMPKLPQAPHHAQPVTKALHTHTHTDSPQHQPPSPTIRSSFMYNDEAMSLSPTTPLLISPWGPGSPNLVKM